MCTSTHTCTCVHTHDYVWKQGWTHTYTYTHKGNYMGMPSRTDAQQVTPAKKRQAISSLNVVIKRLRHSEIF